MTARDCQRPLLVPPLLRRRRRPVSVSVLAHLLDDGLRGGRLEDRGRDGTRAAHAARGEALFRRTRRTQTRLPRRPEEPLVCANATRAAALLVRILNYKLLSKIFIWLGGSPGLVVKGGDSSSKDPEFEYRIMDVNIFTLICC